MVVPLNKLFLFFVPLLIFLVSCTINVPLHPHVEDLSGIQQIPINIGVFFSPEFVDYMHFEGSHGPDEWAHPIGNASKIFFQELFARNFKTATLLKTRSTFGLGSKEVTAIIEPQIVSFDMGPPNLHGFWGMMWAEVIYRFKMYSRKGDLISSWTVMGVGKGTVRPTSKYSPELFSPIPYVVLFTTEDFGRITDLAIEDAGTKFLQSFSHVPENRNWLQQMGL